MNNTASPAEGTQQTAPRATPAAAAGRGPVLTLWPLRLVISAQLLAVLAQPVLAGRYLTGDVDSIQAHAAVGGTIAFLCLLVIAATVLYVLGGRGRPWVLAPALLMFVAAVFQIGAGYSRALELHVPLGVAIVIASVLLAGWVWSPSARRPRGAR